MFERALTPILKQALGQFPVVALTGPRQSGKTTLLKNLFPDRRYISLETPETLHRVMDDPIGFFQQDQAACWIIDEAQKFPDLFSYIQGWVDESPVPGKFILSGSQNFLLLQNISQSLSGRVAILEMLPLTYDEYITYPNYQDLDLWDYLYHGSYPRIYHEKPDIALWYNSYIRTYVERDVRSLIHLKDLTKFQTFLKLCAARHGQLLNLSNIAQACAISQPTAESWLNLLEASYIVFRLPPYYQNFNKRLVKRPKLYFYDSALVCQLLGIESKAHLAMHGSLGSIFEGFVLSEIKKALTAQGKPPTLYFWRSHAGDEIDGLLERGTELLGLEIKSTMTFNNRLLANLERWQTIANTVQTDTALVYAGKESFQHQDVRVIGWRDIGSQLGLS